MSLSLERYLDKLWSALFSEGASGLLSPGEIQREHHDWVQVRDLEVRFIQQACDDLKAIKRGEKTIDDKGHIVEAAKIPQLDEVVEMNPIIERSRNTVDDVEVRLGASRLFDFVRREAQLRDLERSLNVRRVAIYAEQVARGEYAEDCSPRPLDEDWLSRWRDYAEHAYSAALQQIWGRVLAREVRRPGTTSIHTMDFLRHLSAADAELVTIIGKLSFGDFIYREAKSYFTPDIHQPMFENLEDLGLISGVKRADLWLDLQGRQRQANRRAIILRCYSKAIGISAEELVGAGLQIPVYHVTQLGRQVFDLLVKDADMAYLWSVAHDLKSRGFNVQLGDWMSLNKGAGGDFQQKIEL